MDTKSCLAKSHQMGVSNSESEHGQTIESSNSIAHGAVQTLTELNNNSRTCSLLVMGGISSAI